MAGYTRQSEASIQPGEDIDAAPLNAEFDQLETAFGTSGHTHSGSAGDGPKIPFASLLDTIDEDNMASDSATKIPTQQSVKAYVDASAGSGTRSINTQTGTTYTLVLGDAGKVILCDNASTLTITIPTNASVAFPTGTQIDILGYNNDVELDPASTVNLNLATTNVSLGFTNYPAPATLLKIGTNDWLVFGDVVNI